jgi:urease accessory protein
MATTTDIRTRTIMTTPEIPDPAQVLLTWFSPSYPVGAYSHSHGLEAEIAAGRVASGDDLADWLRLVLAQGGGRGDAILLCHAWRADPAALAELAELAAALAPSAERHRETVAQGAAFARVTAEVWGTDPAPLPYPVAVGAAAARLGLPLGATVAAFLHGFAANIVSAAVRFLPLGQTEGQRVLAALLPVIHAVAAEAQAAGLDDLGSAAFGADLSAMAHETMAVRIFRT